MTLDETHAFERAERLISEGVVGDRGLIASMIVEAVTAERARALKIAASLFPTPQYRAFETKINSDI